ncbi:MAG: hypothetical protein HC882_05885 [Acidobacteria bacterium]|nr:hypothetical protein [Acidobacteriota bacterium]
MNPTPSGEVEDDDRPPKTIFDLLTTYHRSLDNMKRWLEESDLDEIERIGIADAWQGEMHAWFRANGYCFACNRALERCTCEPLNE